MNDEGNRIQAALERVLTRRHGHAFQYSVIRHAGTLFEAGQSQWSFEVSEFPVVVQGADTRIDFILRLRSVQHSFFLIAECKKVNAALSEWCFLKAPYIRRNDRSGRVVAERFSLVDRYLSAGITPIVHSADIYHIGFELKGSVEGDEAQGRGAIESAATQVLRGLNGFAELFNRNRRLLGPTNKAWLLPVVFTTARLWVTDTDLSEAEVTESKVVLRPGAARRTPWLWYQYHVSASLRHSIRLEGMPQDLTPSDLLNLENARHIAIVAADGVEQFLSWHGWDWP